MSEAHVAIAEVDPGLFMTAAVEIAPWQEAAFSRDARASGSASAGNEEPGASAPRLFGRTAFHAVQEVVARGEATIILRLRLAPEGVQAAILCSAMTDDDRHEHRLRALAVDVAAALRPWGSRLLGRAELDRLLSLDEDWEAVRVLKRPDACSLADMSVPCFAALNKDVSVWAPLLSRPAGLVDLALFPLACDYGDELARVAAASRVIARREPTWREKMTRNAEAVSRAISQGLQAGSAITWAGPNLRPLARQVACFKTVEDRETRGAEEWRVAADEAGADSLAFMVLDYSGERELLDSLEPDGLRPLELFAELAFTLHTWRSRRRAPAQTDLAGEIELRLERFEQRISHRLEELHQAIAAAKISTELALGGLRRLLERIVTELFQTHYPDRKKTKPLSNMIEDLERDGHVPGQIVLHMDFVRLFGNVGAHVKEQVEVGMPDLAVIVDSLCIVVEWYLSERPAP